MAQSSFYIRQREQLLNQPLFSWPGLGGWSFYFLCKVALSAFDYIQLHWLYNLTFALVLVVPLRYYVLRILRQVIAIPVALSLLYFESYLPPIRRLFAQSEQVLSFSGEYLFELLGRVIQFEFIAALLVAWIVYLYLARTLRMTVIAVLAIVLSPLWHTQTSSLESADEFVMSAGVALEAGVVRPETPDEYIQHFYQEQSELVLPASEGSANFDILMINICSLSWDDLRYTELDRHPLFQQSQIILDNFNSASSYSGPAALRLLHASCGHQPHDDLFGQTPQQCLLTERLAELGYSRELLLNHSGEFDDFRGLLHQHGGFEPNDDVDTTAAPIAMIGFDGTPIRDDYRILSDWVSQPTVSPRFGFYNTTSLHDGNQLPDFAGNSMDSFRTRTETMLDQLLQLYQDIRESGRNVLVVIVPEHGAALRGDKVQLPGLREIPSPTLTHVPVLISLFGEGVDYNSIDQQRITRLTGPFAIAAAIQTIQAQQPFSGGEYQPQAVAEALPVTPWVAENQDVKVMEFQQRILLQLEQQDWVRYPIEWQR